MQREFLNWPRAKLHINMIPALTKISRPDEASCSIQKLSLRHSVPVRDNQSNASNYFELIWITQGAVTNGSISKKRKL